MQSLVRQHDPFLLRDLGLGPKSLAKVKAGKRDRPKPCEKPIQKQKERPSPSPPTYYHPAPEPAPARPAIGIATVTSTETVDSVLWQGLSKTCPLRTFGADTEMTSRERVAFLTEFFPTSD